jgi:hypothetical protein
MPPHDLEPIVEMSGLTIGEFLGELFPGCDIAAGLNRVMTVLETLADRIPAVIERVLIPACEMLERLEKLPPAPGYEPMLIERGHHPLMARGLSHWIIRSGKEEASKAKMQRIVVDAVRFLAKPGRRKGSISRKAALLLQIGNTSSNLGDVFDGAHSSVFELIEALEGAVRGDLAACQRVTEVAAVLAPGLSVPRGPKASAASIAHEFSLACVANMAGPKAYTYNPVSGDFTDPLTRATQLAFGDPGFDPRPALRRQKKRQKRESN